MEEFKILYVSPFDREYIIAELYYNNICIAEVNQEHGEHRIEFFNTDTSLEIPLSQLIDKLNEIKEKL